MMGPIDHAAVLLALIRRLEEVMRAESAILREMRLSRLQALQEEKAALAHGYEAELRRLRTSPERVAALEPEARATLAEAMRRLQATAEGNRRQIEAARRAVEGVVRLLGESAGGPRGASSYRPGPGRRGGQVLSVAFSREA